MALTAAYRAPMQAFCHVTIPSIENRYRRLQHFLFCGRQSLALGLLPHCDTFLKAAITTIPDSAHAITDDELLSFLASFSSFLVVVPGHPEHGPFFLSKGLLNVIRDYSWTTDGAGVQAYGCMISLFCTLAQRKSPYTVEGVEANDTLFARDREYMDELQGVVDRLVDECVGQLPGIKQAAAPLDLLNRLLANAQMTPKCALLAWELFGRPPSVY